MIKTSGRKRKTTTYAVSMRKIALTTIRSIGGTWIRNHTIRGNYILQYQLFILFSVSVLEKQRKVDGGKIIIDG